MKKYQKVRLKHPEIGEEGKEFIVMNVNNKTKRVYIQPTSWKGIPPQELVSMDEIEKI